MNTELIIALVRHGETEWNRQQRWQGRSGVELNETGRQQARAAAEVLQGRPWHWMITSPQLRARETGELILAGLAELPNETDHELVERDYGEADGMLSAEARQRWPDGNFPGSESAELVRQRGAGAVRRIAAGQTTPGIIVAHGGLIRATINELCDIETPRILNGAVSLLATDGEQWRALEINVIPDLDDAAGAKVGA